MSTEPGQLQLQLDAPDSAEQYEVRLEVDGAQCAISVIDTGGGVDLATVNHAVPEASSPGGRGVALMTVLADHLDFVSEPASGTIVRFVKELRLLPDGVLARLIATAEPAAPKGS